MKKLFIGAFALAMVAVSCQQEPAGLTLQGKLDGTTDQPVTVSIYGKDGMKTLDTLQLTNGIVNYTTHLDQPVLVIVGVENSRNRVSFFGENVAYTIDGQLDSLSEAAVTGGELFAAYKTIAESQDAIRKRGGELRNEYNAARQSGDTARQSAIIKEYDAGEKEVEAQQKEFVKNNASSPVAAFMVRNLYGHKSLEEIQEGIAMLDSTLATSPYYVALMERVEKLQNVAIGKVAPDFTMMDVEGNPLSLSALKGKYVLIDFWASWCSPCRQENPHVVELYNEFHEKGFDILGVSLDQKKEAWLKAIADDQLTWNHVSDLKGWKNEVAQLYGVSSIPHTVLLDQEGKIVAKNLRGDELRAKVAELLN